MKKYLLILLVFLGLLANAQTPAPVGYLIQGAKWKMTNPLWLFSGAYVSNLSEFTGDTVIAYNPYTHRIGYRVIPDATIPTLWEVAHRGDSTDEVIKVGGLQFMATGSVFADGSSSTPKTWTFPNATGTVALTSDIPPSSTYWETNGTTFLNGYYLGTDNDRGFGIRTNNIQRIYIDTLGKTGFGMKPNSSNAAKVHINGGLYFEGTSFINIGGGFGVDNAGGAYFSTGLFDDSITYQKAVVNSVGYFNHNKILTTISDAVLAARLLGTGAGWSTSGNTFTNGQKFGTNNDRGFPIVTNSLFAGYVDSLQNWGFGTLPSYSAAPTRVTIRGQTSDLTTQAFRVEKANGSPLLNIESGGSITVNNSGGSGILSIKGSGGNILNLQSSSNSSVFTATDALITCELPVRAVSTLTVETLSTATNSDSVVMVGSTGLFKKRPVSGITGAYLPLAGGTMTGSILAGTTNSYDLGASGTTFRSGYFGTSVITPSATVSNMTLGSVLFAGTGGLVSQDNTNFFWDNTNKRLGIGRNPGTDIPGVTLDVEGYIIAANNKGFISRTVGGTGTTLLRLSSSDDNEYYSINNTKFFTAGTEKWRLTTAGNFIAPTDNTYDIGASGATRPRNIYVGTLLTVPSNGLTINATNVTSTGTQLNYLNAATGRTGTATTNLVFSASPTFTGTVEIGNGNVTPANTSLCIQDNISTGAGLSMALHNEATSTNSISAIKMYGNNGTVTSQIYADGLGTGPLATAGTYLGSFSNHPLGVFTNNTERIRISNAGNVTIGATTSISRFAIPIAPTVTNLYGLISLGSGGFGGGGGEFNGGTATTIAINLANGSTADFFNAQENGVDKIRFTNAGGAEFASNVVSTVSGVDVGSTTQPFRKFYFHGTGTYGTGSYNFGGTPTAGRTLTLPDASGVLHIQITTSATLNFGSTAAGASTDLTMTVSGAVDGDPVAIGVPNGSTLSNGVFTGWVSAADTVTVRFTNTSAGALDPASGTFKVAVTKPF